MPLLVQQHHDSDPSGNIATFLPNDTTEGNSLICTITRLNTDSVPDDNVTAEDDVLAFVASARIGAVTVEVWRADSIQGGGRHFDVVTANGQLVAMNVQEWSGL